VAALTHMVSPCIWQIAHALLSAFSAPRRGRSPPRLDRIRSQALGSSLAEGELLIPLIEQAIDPIECDFADILDPVKAFEKEVRTLLKDPAPPHWLSGRCRVWLSSRSRTVDILGQIGRI
jgi:hypothetical protein